MTRRSAMLSGAAIGTLLAIPALFAALMSGGAGHGDYAIARVLFPVPMLLTLVDGQIGFFAGGAALLQLPLYGTLAGWSRYRQSITVPTLVLTIHFAALALCFSGALPEFS